MVAVHNSSSGSQMVISENCLKKDFESIGHLGWSAVFFGVVTDPVTRRNKYH
jgi:hypothetical protein